MGGVWECVFAQLFSKYYVCVESLGCLFGTILTVENLQSHLTELKSGGDRPPLPKAVRRILVTQVCRCDFGVYG